MLMVRGVPRVRAFVSGLLVGAALLVPAAGAFAYSPDDQELAFLDLINAYRAENGLGTLVLQDELGDAADHHSADMGANDYFAHTLSDGTDAGGNIRNFGYSGGTWGENIAAGMASASDAFVSWQNSPGHNQAMLDPDFTEIGIGREYVEGSSYGWYWTTTFGGGEGGGRNQEPAPAPAQVLDTGDAAAAASDGTVNGAPVEAAPTDGGNVPATVNGVPVESGTVVTTVNGVPVASGGAVVNADGEVITTILDPYAAPVDAATTVAEEASLAAGAETAPVPAEGSSNPSRRSRSKPSRLRRRRISRLRSKRPRPRSPRKLPPKRLRSRRASTRRPRRRRSKRPRPRPLRSRRPPPSPRRASPSWPRTPTSRRRSTASRWSRAPTTWTAEWSATPPATAPTAPTPTARTSSRADIEGGGTFIADGGTGEGAAPVEAAPTESASAETARWPTPRRPPPRRGPTHRHPSPRRRPSTASRWRTAPRPPTATPRAAAPAPPPGEVTYGG
jgi:hypothetical protein